MDRSRLWRICKNYISIVLTIMVMIYFGFANSSLFHSFASELSSPETQEISTESLPGQTEDEPVEEGNTETTGEPTEEENPEAAEEPAESESQEAAEEPAESENPEAAEEPTEEENPEAAEEPAESESPKAAEEPAENENPEAAEEPAESENPEAAEEPAESENPEAAEESAESENPEAAEESTEEENPETAEESAVNEETGDAKITYTYTITDTEAENYGEEVTETLYFVGWSDIFAGIKNISDKLVQSGNTQIVPTVELCRNMEQPETAKNVDNVSLILDLQGYDICLSNGAYLDFGAGMVTIVNQTAVSEQTRPGRIIGDGEKLLSGSGEWTIGNGWYENASGSIFSEAATITVLDGYFISSGGTFADRVGTLNINGGFFSYNESSGLVGYGQMNLPVKKVLAKMTTILWERELTGYSLTDADYMVSVGAECTDESGNSVTVIQEYFYKEFAEAWEQAKALSLVNDGSVATVKIINDQINGISLSKSYVLSSEDGKKAAAIKLDGMYFTRQKGYDGNLFTVNAGRLILNDCTLDGAMEEQSVALASAIRANGGILVLNGSIGTVICNNVSIANEETKDIGAGIYLDEGAQLYLSGKISIKDNLLYDQNAEAEEQRKTPRNLYLAKGASIEIVGSMAVESEVGISCEEDIIVGLTSFGRLADNYLAELKANTDLEEPLNVDGLLSVFALDQYASNYACFNSESNLLFWDRGEALLPEAGVLRIEFIILLIGLFGFIVRNIPSVNKKKVAERIIMVFSIACLLSGTAIGFYHIRQERMITEANMATLQEFYSMKESNAQQEAVEIKESETEKTEKDKTANLSVPEDGREYAMVIEIPALELKLPVLADYSEADMKTSPCVYSGTISEDDLVIVGHNFESQFGKLNEIEVGTEIYLILLDGTSYSYQVSGSEELEPKQVEEMLHSNWDMTLFTCNYAGDKRLAVRCRAVK